MDPNFGTLILPITSLTSTSMAVSNEEKSMNNEETRIVEAITAMTSAFDEKNIDGLLTSYEEGAVVNFEPGNRVSSPAALTQMFEGAFQINPKFTYPKGHEVFVSNGIALHIAPWTMKGRAPDGSDIEQSGLSVAVLRKQDTGKWLLVVDNPHGQMLLHK